VPVKGVQVGREAASCRDTGQPAESHGGTRSTARHRRHGGTAILMMLKA